MGLPLLETCCFLFDLKTGNIILGCLNATLSFIMFVIMIVVASTVGTIQKAEVIQADMRDEQIEEEAAITGVYVMTIILVLMFLVKFLFDVFFVYGVVKEIEGVIRAYFVMWTVFILLSMFTFFLNVANYEAGTICTELFYAGLNIYAVLVAYSYYKQLNNREIV